MKGKCSYYGRIDLNKRLKYRRLYSCFVAKFQPNSMIRMDIGNDKTTCYPAESVRETHLLSTLVRD